jgi:hypothetical protein
MLRQGDLGEIPQSQRSIRDRCFHPFGNFIAFEETDVEPSIPARFEEQVRRYSDRAAVQDQSQEMDALNTTGARTLKSRSGDNALIGYQPIWCPPPFSCWMLSL